MSKNPLIWERVPIVYVKQQDTDESGEDTLTTRLPLTLQLLQMYVESKSQPKGKGEWALRRPTAGRHENIGNWLFGLRVPERE